MACETTREAVIIRSTRQTPAYNMLQRIVTAIRQNLVAWLSLFVAIGGTSLAAKRYLITSTGQIKPSVLKQLKGKTGQAGPAGPQGPTGPEGARGAQGPQGAAGRTGQSATPLLSGQTERGVIGMANVVGDRDKEASDDQATFASLPIPAPVALDNGHVLVAGVSDKGVCEGSYASPTAPGGDVCIYINFTANAKIEFGFVPNGEPTPFGFGVFYVATAKGENAFIEGDWAYTAP